MPRSHSRHLYTNKTQRRQNVRAFERRYGATKGRRIYGAVVGKVRREEAAEGRRGKRVWIKSHRSHSRLGTPTRVKGHFAILRL